MSSFFPGKGIVLILAYKMSKLGEKGGRDGVDVRAVWLLHVVEAGQCDLGESGGKYRTVISRGFGKSQQISHRSTTEETLEWSRQSIDRKDTDCNNVKLGGE